MSNPRTFTCDMCGEHCESGWSEAEAEAELAENFPGIPKELCARVCDDCWEKIKPDGGEIEIPVPYEDSGDRGH